MRQNEAYFLADADYFRFLIYFCLQAWSMTKHDFSKCLFSSMFQQNVFFLLLFLVLRLFRKVIKKSAMLKFTDADSARIFPGSTLSFAPVGLDQILGDVFIFIHLLKLHVVSFDYLSDRNGFESAPLVTIHCNCSTAIMNWDVNRDFFFTNCQVFSSLSINCDSLNDIEWLVFPSTVLL